MKHKLIISAVTALLFFTFTSGVHAHGGLSMEDDGCKLRIGHYQMHMSGYIPDTIGGREFCEDVPEAGRVIVVFDMLQEKLRDMPTEFRIIRDNGGETDVETDTIFHLPPKIYPSGTFNFDHTYDGKGKYVGLVTINNAGQKITSRFPFSVGYGDTKKHAWEISWVAVPFVLFMLFLGWRWRRDKHAKQRAAY